MDGHSPLLAWTNDAFVSYDPAYAYEIRHIVRDALERWYGPETNRNRDVMYYLTVYNEPMVQPAEPAGVDVEGIIKGIHKIADAPEGDGPEVQLLASGVAVPWVLEARRLLVEDWNVRASVWSVTSWGELRREALAVERENLLSGAQRVPYLVDKLTGAQGPFIATSDFDHALPDLIRPWVPGRYDVLGADGYGFSDTRAAARRHYLIDAESVVVKALRALADEGRFDRSAVRRAVERYDLGNVNAGRSGAQGGDS
jgi:pyruvate dehydrogenase E1 component